MKLKQQINTSSKILLIFMLVLSSIFPFPFLEGESPPKIEAASDIPKYNGSNGVKIEGLIRDGDEEYPGDFWRVDKPTVAGRLSGLSNVVFLGEYRYTTIFQGFLTATGRNAAAAPSVGINTSFPIPETNKTASQVYKHDPWFHMVPDDLTTARNLIRTGDLDKNTFKSVYGGSLDNYDNLTVFRPKGASGSYGTYYYIGDVVGKAGGFAQNVYNDDFDSVNPTRLQILTTAFPNITEFKSDKTTYNVNEPIKMSFKGFEYVYGDNKTKFDYTLNVKRDGVAIGSSISGTGNSTKGATSTVAVPAQDSGHTGAIDVPSFEFKPEQAGTYTLTLTLLDYVLRDVTKTITVNVINLNQPALTIAPAQHQTDVGKTVKYTAQYTEGAGKPAIDVTTTSAWTAVDATNGQSLTRGDYKGLKVGTTQVKATYAGLTATATLIVGAAPPPPPEVPNLPPVVELKHPDKVYVGEKVCIYADASDPDGYIAHYQWSYISGDIQTDDWSEKQYTSSSVCTIYEQVGEKSISCYLVEFAREVLN